MSQKIRITMDVDDEYADPDHAMGVTEEGHLEISEALAPYGDDIEFERA
jgi:hypothetical protein